MSKIETAIRKLRALGSGPTMVSHRGQEPFRVKFDLLPPAVWDPDAVEATCGVSLPPDLKAFWDEIGGARLFIDAEYGQWGLILWSPTEVIQRSPQEVAKRPKDCRPGDLFIGKFVGDQELLLIRCAASDQDFGHVQVALEIDPRPTWPGVADSFGDFLIKYVHASGDKFWH
jgi:SMI1 / KNR4 family (SUKH-1)